MCKETPTKCLHQLVDGDCDDDENNYDDEESKSVKEKSPPPARISCISSTTGLNNLIAI